MRNLPLLLLLVVLACNQDSGPCEYDINRFEAKVTAIEEYEPGKFHVVMEFTMGSIAAKPQYLDELKSVEIDSSFVARNHIKVGNIYLGDVSDIISGDCTPFILSFDNSLN